MNGRDRELLLATASPARGEVWCDMGCGDGAFAIPLIERLGEAGRLIAIDRDGDALATLRAALEAGGTSADRFELRVADLTSPGVLPPLDGVVFANSLHYLRNPANSLGAMRSALKPGARVLIIEYDRTDANPWVPYPIPVANLERLAREASYPPFAVTARVPSDFGRTIYAAVATWP